MAVCAALEGGAVGSICLAFLETCRPGPGWGDAGDSSCSQPSRQTHRVMGWGRGAGRGWVGGVRKAFSGRWSRQMPAGCTESSEHSARYLISRLDHCSRLFLPLPLLPPKPLQSTQLAAARAMLPNHHKSDHITPHSPAPPSFPSYVGGKPSPVLCAGLACPAVGAGKDGSFAPPQAHHPHSPCALTPPIPPPPSTSSSHTGLFATS